MSILTCMYDSNFADEVCHTFVDMSTELWTRGLGNVECISCCLMLQITYLGVYKGILCPRVMCLHTPRMYFRLQPVCSISLCSVGFANVDVFLIRCVIQKWPKSHILLQIRT